MTVRFVSDVNIVHAIDEEGMTIGSHGEAMLINIHQAVYPLSHYLVRNAPRAIRMRNPHETSVVGPSGYWLVVRPERQPAHTKLIRRHCLGNDLARGIGHRIVQR